LENCGNIHSERKEKAEEVSSSRIGTTKQHLERGCMTKIIGGLLVASLLSGPTAEHMGQHTNEITMKISEYNLEVENKEKTEQVKIEELMGKIDEKNRSLKSLLKERKKVLVKIQALMDLRAYTKTPLNERQISLFSDFTGFYTEKAGALQETLKKIDFQKDLQTTKKELLHNQADYSMIMNELMSLSETQSDAICYLHSIIESGERTLQVL